MKAAAVMMLALVEIGTGSATGARVAPGKLVADPKSYVGKSIVVSGIACVDDPKGGFICVLPVGGQALRIEASSLGAKTALEIAERLIGDCKGTANILRDACRVDAEITPTAGYRDTIDTPNGSQPISVLIAPQIEMYAPRRR